MSDDLQLGFDWTAPAASPRLRFPGMPSSALLRLVCQACGREFAKTARQLRGQTGRFCSVGCGVSISNQTRGPIRRPPRVGAANPNWKGGVAKDHMRYKMRFVRKSPEKVRAHRIVHRALKSGRLVPEDCQHCGSGVRVHAHHDDYSKPLEVIWLCQPCHNRHHAKLRMRGKNP